LKDTPADFTLYGADAGDYAGRFVFAHDINGDGRAELMISAIYADGIDNERKNCGEVYIIDLSE